MARGGGGGTRAVETCLRSGDVDTRTYTFWTEPSDLSLARDLRRNKRGGCAGDAVALSRAKTTHVGGA